MRSNCFFVAATTACLAAAFPQGIDFAAVINAPQPTILGAPVIGVQDLPLNAAPYRRRDAGAISACAPQPTGFAPPNSPDTAASFVVNGDYTDIANNATIPQGYQLVFSNLQGATQQDGYLGYSSLRSYDPVKCQEYCDAVASCTAFNVYIERQPLQWPADGCPDPPSTANYKCSLYGLPINNGTATNVGQYMDEFQVVITGSNGYVKNTPPAFNLNFDGPSALGGAIQPPAGDTSYIGMRLYPGPYDPSQCAATCQATTNFDRQHLVRADGTYDACNFFNSYVLSMNNVPRGTYCMFFTRSWDRSYATNVGQYDNQGNYYSVSSSYSYTLDPLDPGMVSASSSS